MGSLKCVACNNTKSSRVDTSLEGDALEMFNFVCCLELSQPEGGICKECNDELKVSFNFKKRCLEIFANVYEHLSEHNQNDDEFACLDSLLDQTLHEDENSLNLNDLLIPEVCLGNSALSILDVSDNTKCRYCFTEFSSKEECLSHIEEHKGDDKPYKCPQDGCNSSFKARKNLKDHYLVHSNERPFPCHFCEQTFKSSSNRSKHERRIHSKERSAMRVHNNQQQLTKLIEKVKVELPLPPSPAVKVKKEPPATITAIVYTAPSSADDEDRVFRCEQFGCLSSFKTRSSLRDHQKVHSDDRPYPCAFCNSAFKSSSNRSKHERGSHQNDYQKRKLERENQKNGDVEESSPSPPKKIKTVKIEQSPKIIKQEPVTSPKKGPTEFPCRYCDKVLTRADNRDKHEATHKDIRAFDCGFCSKNFKTQEALREHTVQAHRRDRRSFPTPHIKEEEIDIEYICDEDNCGKVYTTIKSLRNHKRVKHYENDDISCDICLQAFKTSELSEHLKKHI